MGEQIEEKENTKYLGILIDNKLSWKHHINHVNLKVTRGIAILYKLRRYVSNDTLRMLFFSFVHPHINYGLLVWGNATKSNLKVIVNKLDKAIRLMTYKKKNIPVEPLYDKLKILNFDDLRMFTIGNFMWKLTNNETPKTIKNNFTLRHKVYGDHNYKYYLPLANTEILKRNIRYQGPLVWNSIPSDIKMKMNIQCFKNSFRKFLFNNNKK